MSQQMFQIASTPVNTHMDIFHARSRPFKNFGQVAKSLTKIKDEWGIFYSLSNVAEHAEVINRPTDENCKEWRWGNLWNVPPNQLFADRHWYAFFPPLFVWRTNSWSLSNHFTNTPYISTMGCLTPGIT